MLTPEQEQQIIDLALRRRLLTPEQVELHAPESRPPSATADARRISAPTPPPATASKRGFPTYGPRIDRLRRLGLIDDATINELNTELRSSEMTTETAAVKTGEQPPSAGSAAVRVQLPLPEPLRRWTRYELLDVLGQGGMGVVYKARDRRLGRMVALKFIRLSDPKMAQRFLNEARAQARITHDNICKVYEVDEVAGQPYIAMEFVDGQSVLTISSQLSLVNKVKLMQDIADALHAAHRIGIIHRDMKPQNVLVEQKPDGRLRPVVMDFGLARDVRSRLNLTESGVVLGTPEYMSPEQARGNSGDQRIDARTDVYSLGAMLYELLCGQPPFEGSTSVQVLISVINDDVVPVRSRNPAIPDPLDMIVMNCLSKEPEGRYPTARALAEDLGRFLAGEPIHARRPSQSQSRPNSLRPVMTPTPASQPSAAITQRHLHVGTGALLAFALLVTLAALVVVVVRVRMQRATALRTASETQRAAQLFAKDVREFELFMRAAYALPLHNIRREQEHIRQRIAKVEGQLTSLPTENLGPAHYAIGRGLMLLRDWEAAQRQLEQALANGFDAPELHFALGLVYGARFERAADESRQNPDEGWVAQRLRQHEQEFLQPAQKHIDQALSNGNATAELEAPAYAAALSQYYRSQFDNALASIARAAAEAPWLPAIAELEARLLRERATQPTRKDAALYANYDLRRASEALRRAIDMARSNPSLYIEHARVGLLLMQRPEPSEPKQLLQQTYEQILDSCQKALVAQPELALAYSLIAAAEVTLAARLADRGEDPRTALERGEVALTEASRLSAKDAPLFLIANQLNIVRLRHLARQGQDIIPSLLTALDWAQQATKLYPAWTALFENQARLYMMRADHQAARGQEPKPDLEHASASLRHVLDLQMQSYTARTALGQVHLRLAQRAFSRGDNPQAALSQARELFGTVLASSGHAEDREAGAGLRETYLVEVEYRLLTSQEALLALAEGLQLARRLSTVHKLDVEAQDGLARTLLINARLALGRGEDPAPYVTEAMQAIERGLKLRANDAELLAHEAELRLLTTRHLQQQRRPFDAELRRAFSALQASLASHPQRSQSYVLLARYYLFSSETGPASAVSQALQRGLEASGRALDLSPGTAQALLLQGLLLLGQAERTRAAERASAAQPALAAIQNALRANPLLKAEAQPALDRCAVLTGQAGHK